MYSSQLTFFVSSQGRGPQVVVVHGIQISLLTLQPSKRPVNQAIVGVSSTYPPIRDKSHAISESHDRPAPPSAASSARESSHLSPTRGTFHHVARFAATSGTAPRKRPSRTLYTFHISRSSYGDTAWSSTRPLPASIQSRSISIDNRFKSPAFPRGLVEIFRARVSEFSRLSTLPGFPREYSSAHLTTRSFRGFSHRVLCPRSSHESRSGRVRVRAWRGCQKVSPGTTTQRPRERQEVWEEEPEGRGEDR